MTDQRPHNSFKILFGESIVVAEPNDPVVDLSSDIQPIKREIAAIVFAHKSDDQFPLGLIIDRQTFLRSERVVIGLVGIRSQ